MLRYSLHQIEMLDPRHRQVLPACLLVVGFFSMAMLTEHLQVVAADDDPATTVDSAAAQTPAAPVASAQATPAPAASAPATPTTPSTATPAAAPTTAAAPAARQGSATLYFVDPTNGTLVASQVIHDVNDLQVPAGYTLLEPRLAASVADTLAGGFSTTMTLKVTKTVTATITYRLADGTTVGTQTLSGLAGTTQTFTPKAPAGYQLPDATARPVTLSADDSDDVSVTVAPIKQAVTTTSTPDPAPAAITVRYVNDDTPIERQVATQTLTGVVGETGTFTVQVPTGYQLAPDQKPRLAYRFTGAAAQTLVIHLNALPKQTTTPPDLTTKHEPSVDQPTNTAATTTPDVALATVTVVDDAGKILKTHALWGQPGQRIMFDTPSLVAPFARQGLRVVSDQTKATAVFTGSAQRFAIHVTKVAPAPAPLARPEAVPFATDEKAQHAAQQPSGHSLIALTPKPQLIATALAVSAPVVPESNPDQLAPVIMSHSRLFPDAIFGRGGGNGQLSGLAAYFVALSGKINYGIKAGN